MQRPKTRSIYAPGAGPHPGATGLSGPAQRQGGKA